MCVGGGGGSVQGVSVRGVSVQGSLCLGGVSDYRVPTFSN